MSASYEERQVLDFFEKNPDASYSAVEVCRKAGTKRQFQENPRWAIPILVRLREQGAIEDDGAGHYRLAQDARD
jgi:hypothetical protein